MIESIEVDRKDLICKPIYQLYGSLYGGKIPAIHMMKHNGRLKRIYTMNYGNSPTTYIIHKNKKLIVDIY